MMRTVIIYASKTVVQENSLPHMRAIEPVTRVGIYLSEKPDGQHGTARCPPSQVSVISISLAIPEAIDTVSQPWLGYRHLRRSK
jgi:hypothetical protein